jgi:hypothetical protein
MDYIRTCDPRPRVAFAEARRFADEVHSNWKHDNIRAVFPPFTLLRSANTENTTPVQMEMVLFHKFTQHENLKRELLATGDAELIEVRLPHYDIMRLFGLTGVKCRTRTKTRSGGVGRTGRVGTSSGRPLCGFVNNCEHGSAGSDPA